MASGLQTREAGFSTAAAARVRALSITTVGRVEAHRSKADTSASWIDWISLLTPQMSSTSRREAWYRLRRLQGSSTAAETSMRTELPAEQPSSRGTRATTTIGGCPLRWPQRSQLALGISIIRGSSRKRSPTQMMR